MLKPTTTASALKFQGRVIDVSSERLRYANGREYDIDFVRHPGASAVVAVDAQERLCMVRQYRHGIRLGKPAEVIELAVLAIRVLDVPVAVAHRGGGQHGDGVLADHA